MDKETRLEVIRFYENIMNEELVERALIRSHFHDKDDLKMNVIKPFTTEQLKSFSGIECFYWINLCYLSYVKCSRWKKTYCIAHEIQCGWVLNKIRIHFRYTDEELRGFLEMAQKYIEKIEREEKVLKRQNQEISEVTPIII